MRAGCHTLWEPVWKCHVSSTLFPGTTALVWANAVYCQAHLELSELSVPGRASQFLQIPRGNHW